MFGFVVFHTFHFFYYTFRPHPHVKHYHIKQNSRGEFYLSEKHCCNSIPELINYHKHNSGGLASRLKTSPCDRPAPATAGLSHGIYHKVHLYSSISSYASELTHYLTFYKLTE